MPPRARRWPSASLRRCWGREPAPRTSPPRHRHHRHHHPRHQDGGGGGCGGGGLDNFVELVGELLAADGGAVGPVAEPVPVSRPRWCRKRGRSCGTPSAALARATSQPAGHWPLPSALMAPLHLAAREEHLGLHGHGQPLEGARAPSRGGCRKTAGKQLGAALRDEVSRTRRSRRTGRRAARSRGKPRARARASLSSAVSSPSSRSHRVGGSAASQRNRGAVAAGGGGVEVVGVAGCCRCRDHGAGAGEGADPAG